MLVLGLGPVGLAALMLAKAMGASKLIGVDTVPARLELAQELELADHVLTASAETANEVKALTGGDGVERALDASGSAEGRLTAIRATHKWGKIVFVGEGGEAHFAPSPDMIHDQKTLYGSWVTSTWKMEELVERLVRWGIHPEDLVTHRFGLEQAADAYALMARGECGKVAVVFE